MNTDETMNHNEEPAGAEPEYIPCSALDASYTGAIRPPSVRTAHNLRGISFVECVTYLFIVAVLYALSYSEIITQWLPSDAVLTTSSSRNSTPFVTPDTVKIHARSFIKVLWSPVNSSNDQWLSQVTTPELWAKLRPSYLEMFRNNASEGINYEILDLEWKITRLEDGKHEAVVTLIRHTFKRGSLIGNELESYRLTLIETDHTPYSSFSLMVDNMVRIDRPTHLRGKP